MSRSLMPPVEGLRIGGLETRHDPRQRLLTRLDHQMDVVVHQAVRQKLEAELLPVEGQTIQIPLPIAVVSIDALALVSPRNHVVQRPGELQPQRTSHPQLTL